jgi:hypothetical protein
LPAATSAAYWVEMEAGMKGAGRWSGTHAIAARPGRSQATCSRYGASSAVRPSIPGEALNPDAAMQPRLAFGTVIAWQVCRFINYNH